MTSPADPSLLAGTSAGALALRELSAIAVDLVAGAAADPAGPAWTAPPETDLRADVEALDPLPADGVGPGAALRELGSVVRHGVRTADPRAGAHLHTAPLAVAAAAELVIGATNQSMDSYDQAPAATFVEDRLVRALAELAGLPETASGVLTAGGTASNLLGLRLARDAAMRAAGRDPLADPLPPNRWRILASAEAHFSVRRAAALMGLGGDAVVPVRCDAAGRMDAAALNKAADEVEAIAVVATAGTTDLGAIDSIAAAADAAEARGAWLHVDAAVGGALLFSPVLRDRLAGIERADSITTDLHKLLWQPIGASALLVRDAEAFAGLREPSPYLDREEDDALNLVSRSLDTSRRFDALKVLASLRALGTRQVGALVEHLLALATHAARTIDATPGLTLVAEPETVCVVFRGGDEVAVQRALLASGRAVVGRTTIAGSQALKLTFVNPAATTADVEALVALIASECAS